MFVNILLFEQFHQTSYKSKTENEQLLKTNKDLKYLRMFVYFHLSEVGSPAQVAGFGVVVSPR